MNNKREYIICAAIKRIKQRDCIKHYYENDLYDIEIGYRHCDIFARFGEEISKNPYDQGFYTSKGRFVDRKNAMYIAWNAGQVSDDVALKCDIKKLKEINNSEIINYFNKLYSEDLY
jgi:hypothetical protein